MREGNSGIDLVKAITRLSFCSAAVTFKFARSVFILLIKKKKKNKSYGWVDTVWSLQQRSPLARLRHTEHTASERSSVGTAATLITRWVSSLFKIIKKKTLRFYFSLLPRFFIAGHLKFSLMPQEEFWESAVNFVRKLKLGPHNLGHSCLLGGAFTVMSVLRRRAAELFETTKQVWSNWVTNVLFHTHSHYFTLIFSVMESLQPSSNVLWPIILQYPDNGPLIPSKGPLVDFLGTL